MRQVMRPELRTLLSVYQRTVRASLDRIWENVLDWEHLPHLHRQSFSAIRPLESSPQGWRAVVSFPGRRASEDATIEVELDRPARRYFTRTISGAGEGTEILTYLEPLGRDTSRIAVEFRSPDVEPERAPEAGAAFTRLYSRLWAEDESMMIRRQKLLDGDPALARHAERALPEELEPVALGEVGQLRSRLPQLIQAHGRWYRLVALDNHIFAHSLVCPHRGGPLEEAALEGSSITCPWHGYRFDVRTGRNLDGHPLHLESPPRVYVDPRSDEAMLVFPRPLRK